MKRALQHASLAVTLGAAYGCGSATAPTGYTKNTFVPPLAVTCVTTSTLACRASFGNDGEVTASASWSAADSFALATNLPVTASDAVVFRSPGVPTPLTARNVYIRADYDSSRYGHVRNIALHAYGLAPGEAPVPLAYLSGGVYEGAAGASPTVPSATVAIVAGEGAGKTASTNVVGYYTIEFLRLGGSFTIRAGKDGDSTDTREHPGIVDGPSGYPSNASLDFNIGPPR
jgi:hypothetical protein